MTKKGLSEYFNQPWLGSGERQAESAARTTVIIVVVVWTNMNGILSESPGFCSATHQFLGSSGVQLFCRGSNRIPEKLLFLDCGGSVDQYEWYPEWITWSLPHLSFQGPPVYSCCAGEVIEYRRNCFSSIVVVVWTDMNDILSESPGFCHTLVFRVLPCTVVLSGK